ncbi:MAG TPA: aromatic acid exporter family protein [Symbiobacteriaceae bacterium]|nr:aromatic acid exporter family protein [Symbiobacteriaceae bacterium]
MTQIGPRLWKTGLAVAITIALVRLAGHGQEVMGAVAAALAVAPSVSRSFRTLTNQLIANLIGCLAGAAVTLLFGPTPLAIGGAVVLVLWICQRFGLKDLALSVVTVTLFVSAPHAESIGIYMLWRFLAVMIGSVAGTAVNAFISPPDYFTATMQAIAEAGQTLDSFILSVTGRLEQPHHIEKAEILATSAKVEALITEARRLSLLLGESQRPEQKHRKEVVDRAIKVLSSLLERTLVIHKAALAASRAAAYTEQLPEIQAALAQVVGRRQHLYASLMRPDAEHTLGPSLAELERRFESAPGLPTCEADADPFFRLYRMRSSVSYMANRLGRLYVAKEAALLPYGSGLGTSVPASIKA